MKGKRGRPKESAEEKYRRALHAWLKAYSDEGYIVGIEHGQELVARFPISNKARQRLHRLRVLEKAAKHEAAEQSKGWAKRFLADNPGADGLMARLAKHALANDPEA